MDIRLNGKAALITGGSTGLGLAMARRFAASGADVGNAESVRRLFADAERGLGKVDILINNAGASSTGAFETLTDEVWMQDFDLKLFSAIRLCRLAWPSMKARRWGR